MKERWFHLPSLVVAACAALLIAAAPFSSDAGTMLVRPMLYLAGVVAALLFIGMLFDPGRHRAIHQANIDMRGGQSLGNRPRIKLLDPEWGLFGKRAGTRALLAVRALLLAELLVAALFSGRDGSDVALLAFTAAFITILLGLARLPVPSR